MNEQEIDAACTLEWKRIGDAPYPQKAGVINDLIRRAVVAEHALIEATHCECGKRVGRGMCNICDNDD